MLQTKELAHFQKQKLLAEERLSESEFKFGALFNSMNEGVALHKLLYDAQGQAIDYEIQDINPAYERHTGISAQEAKGKRASELYKSGNPPYFDIYTAVATTGVSQELETYFEPLDRYFVISVTSPSPGYFATIFTDISDRKRNEEELLKRQERLNLLYILSHMESDDENAVIELALNSALTTSESESGYIAFIENGNICFDKMSWAGKAGGSDKLMKQYRNLLETDEFLTRSWKTGKRIIENDHVIENPLNTELPITRSVQIVIKENGKVLVLAGMFNKKTHYIIDDARHFELFLTEMWNIIQKKRSAKELLDSQNRFKTLANATYEGITIIENGEIIDINQQLTAMTGYSSEELLHRKVIDFVAPHSVEKFREIIQTDLSQSYEYDIVKRDGSMLSIEVRTRKYQVGERLLLISSVHDMTRVKRDQEILKESVKQLELSNKELEQFAYVASHDLQEPLRMVSSFTQLLAKKYKGKLGADADEYISYAVGGATRMQILINDLLDYSRVTRKGNPFKEISLSTVLGKAIINLKKKIDETRAVITNDELPVIHGDETQLIRLFQNLIENSLKYRSELLPHIHLGAVQVEHGWQIAVTDNGIGIDKEYKERIFEIFERLHSANKYPGTGIGLSICKKIVERHGGQIWVESNREMGVTFYFTILQKEV
jgi:PAS domain S-box-containing protein